MSKFNVLSLGEFIHKEGIDVALEAFADLYYDVTSKHQKQMKLIMVTKGTLQDYIDKNSAKISRLFHQTWLNRYPWPREVIFDDGSEFKIFFLDSTERF